MIKGKTTNNITKEKILKLISSYDIYRYYNGPFKVNSILVNKHRGEKNPSLIISSRLKSVLTHKDFGDSKWKGDCFDFVKQIHNCNFFEALSIINRDFNLGLNGKKIDLKNKVITWKKPVIEINNPPLFQIIYYDGYTKEALDYWKKLGQSEEDLKREKIYQPKEIWRNKAKLPLGSLLTFCYYYKDIKAWKIYRPFAPKRTKNTFINQWKWDTNVPFDYVDNMSSLENSDMIVISKSKKDRMVLMKALGIKNIIDIQAEDVGCLSKALIDRFPSFKTKIIVGDNDKKGTEFSWWLTNNYGFKHVNVPYEYLNSNPKCTDFADLCYNYGIEKVTEYFKSKSNLNGKYNRIN